MHKSWILIFVLAMMPLVSALDCDYIGTQNQDMDFSIQVYNANMTKTSSNTDCYFTLRNPDLDVIIDDSQMDYNTGGYFNHTIPASNISETGEYPVNIRCDNVIEAGISAICIDVTPNGERTNSAKAVLYLGSLFALIIFLIISVILIFSVERVEFKFLWFYIAWLFVIAITFVAWNLTGDFLTANSFITQFFFIAFYVSVFLLFPFVLATIGYQIYLAFWKTEFKKLLDERGIPEFEAEDFMKRSRRARGRR